MSARLGRVRGIMAERGVDALVVTHLPNIFFLTGFDGSAAIVVVTADRLYFLTDFRYVAAAELTLGPPGAVPDLTFAAVETSYEETLASLLRELPALAIGFESSWMPVARYLWLTAALGVSPPTASEATDPGGSGRRLVPTDGVIERVRVCKDEAEVRTLREAGGTLSSLVPRVLKTVRPGRTEREVAARIDWIVKDAGFDRVAFETIVASGPNAALPHARPGSRRLRAGELILLDFGGVSDGYFVDLSRTVALGEPGSEARRVYQAVFEAQAAAIAAVRPGVPAAEVDRAARTVLAQHGLAEAFGHATGHGLGVELHEAPRIAKARPAPVPGDGRLPGGADEGGDRLAPGMVFTVEPGVYRPGWGGVRIEDDILVTDDGCEWLTGAPCELRIV